MNLVALLRAGSCLLSAILLGGCLEPPQGPGEEPLPDLFFVPNSAPTSHIERGVDAEAGAAYGVRVEWQEPGAGDLAQVELLRARGDDGFAQIDAYSPAQTSTIDFVPEHGTWRYTLRGRDHGNRTKASVDTVTITLIQPAEPISPAPQQESDPAPIFQWSWPEFGALPLFVVRVQTAAADSAWISPRLELFAGPETLEIVYGEELTPPDLAPGNYRWRVDAIDPSNDMRGSESPWTDFRVGS